MFDELVESRPRRQRSPAQALASIAVHTVIIAVSIQLTRAVAATVTKTTADTPLFVARAPAPGASQPAAATATAAAFPAAPALPSVPAPVVVPTSIPSVTQARGFDPLRAGTAGDRHGPPSGAPSDNVGDSDRLVTLVEAEEPVTYLDGPEPKYPPALRQVGVEGSVRLRYIVGTDGKVEPGSVLVLMSTNKSFETPAIEAIKGSRFRPARVKGQKVRQLVEQMVRFTIH